jgi:TldD protein
MTRPLRQAAPAPAAIALAIALSSAAAPAQSAPSSPVLLAMKAELARNFTALKAQPTAPYFLSYEITEHRGASVSSAFGALGGSNDTRNRRLDITLRVGSYNFDNTHAVRGDFASVGAAMARFGGAVPIPVDDDPAGIRKALWYETDRHYKQAVEQLAGAKTNAQVAVVAEDRSPDFSAGPVVSYTEPVVLPQVDRAVWEKRLRSYTAPFAQYGDIYDARAQLDAAVETRWYVNSEGTQLQVSEPSYRLIITAFSKADDGMELPRYESYFATTPSGLPSDDVVLKAVGNMVRDLHALRTAPVVDPYSGPAILSGRAAAVFFHEVFGHRVEGHRQKDEGEGQTFKKRVNEQVLPTNFTVFFDPTLKRLGPVELAGSYRYDNEGIAARRVTSVDNGIFKSFIMSRSPIDGFPSSNGHGRKQTGFAPVARQSNLVVQVTQPVTRAALKQMLIDQLKRDNKPYGLLFDDIEGGFTITQRVIPNAFNVLPIMVYRIFPDGRQELVRGVDFIGTPLTTFSKIVAADDEVATFNGICGAESGGVPVSASSPAIFLSQVEVQKKLKSQERPPILPAPLNMAPRPAVPHEHGVRQ